jgi:hypothetical protein
MEKTQLLIPRRLYLIRVVVTIALILSFLMSIRLWGSDTFFPDVPFFDGITLNPLFSHLLVGGSIVFLLCSLILKHHRLFIALSILINIVLIALDLNRLQAWFYVYNAILFVLLFYNGRVDDSGKFTGIFIIIQLIIASVYFFNGISQLNSNFAMSDFQSTVAPLGHILSQRQFTFFSHLGKYIPVYLIFLGTGLLWRPLRYLSLPAAWLFHLLLLVLLVAGKGSANYALWFMNLVFSALILLLFYGRTAQRYFNWTLLFQKPLFFAVMFAFWMVPVFNQMHYWPKSPTTNFMNGKTNDKKMLISQQTFDKLPYYLKTFCDKTDKDYTLQLSRWCRVELASEYMSHATFNNILWLNQLAVGTGDVKETEEELSSL